MARQKLYSKLGLHSLSKRRWDSKLMCLCKIWNGVLPKHLHLYPTFSSQENYPFRSVLKTKINSFPWRIKSFRKTFSPYCINEWNNLNTKVGNAKSSHFFKKMIVIETKVKSLFSVYEPLGVKLLTRISKIWNGFLPKHLHLYPTFSSQENYPFRSVLKTKINSFPWRIKSFRKTFSPYCINEWNNLNTKVGNAKSSHFFKKMIVIETKVKSLFSVYEPLGVKLLTRIRLQFSHLDKHKFRHGFGDTVCSM